MMGYEMMNGMWGFGFLGFFTWILIISFADCLSLETDSEKII